MHYFSPMDIYFILNFQAALCTKYIIMLTIIFDKNKMNKNMKKRITQKLTVSKIKKIIFLLKAIVHK